MGRCVPPCCCPQPQRQRQHGGYRRMRACNPTLCQALPTPPLFTCVFQHLSQACSWMRGCCCSSSACFALPKSQGLIRTSAKAKGRLPQAPSSLPRARGLIASLACYPAGLARGSSPPQNTSPRSCHPLSNLTRLLPGPKQHRQEPRGTKPSSGPEREQQGEIRDAESDRSAWNEARRLVLTPLKMGRVPPERG